MSEWVLELYGAEDAGWTAKHFHERLQDDDHETWSDTWVESRLQDARLLPKAPKRGGIDASGRASPASA